MTLPVRREGYVPVPRQPTDAIVPEPVVLHTSSDAGWMVALLGASGTLLTSWTLFGLYENGMWAGYWCSLLCMTAIMAALGLRTSLPRLPLVATLAFCGGLLIVLGIFKDWGTIPLVAMVAGGAAIVIGAGMQTASNAR